MATFHVGDQVEKFTGDYQWHGEVRAVFEAYPGGPTRVVVSHPIPKGNGSGFVLHIYAPANIRHRAE